jgi:quercetin dioxygenase-like cupin family protein
MYTPFNQRSSVMVTSKNLVAAGEGQYVHFQGLGTRNIFRGERAGGAVAVSEHDLAPRELGSPMHTHTHEDEISHVTSGRLGVQIGDEVLVAGPGDTVFKPRGVPHAFWNAGDEPVRFLELFTPGAFQDYFAEIEGHLNVEGPPDVEALGAVMARYGLEMDMDSIGPLVEAHGLNAPPM